MTRGLGIDIGGTKLLAIVREADGSISYRRRYATGRAFSPFAAVQLVREVVQDAVSVRGPIGGIGVGFPGLVQPRNGVARSSVILDGWHDVPFAARVESATQLPCAIDNDVNNAARAELSMRPHANSFFFVAIGTGIGGALVLDQRVWSGAGGLAGEFGHICIDRDGDPCNCGRRGCVGPFAGGEGIEKRLGIAAGSLAAYLAENPAVANETLAEAGEALGSAIASAMNLVNPELVVLGGGLAELSVYRTNVEATARREAFAEIQADCRFESAISGYDAGAIGAAILSQQAAAPTAIRLVA